MAKCIIYAHKKKELTQNGSAVTGWKELDGSMYYFNEKEAYMTTGWEQIQGKWYYFKKDNDGVNWSGPTGTVLRNVQNVWIENKYYNFDVNGVCTNL